MHKNNSVLLVFAVRVVKLLKIFSEFVELCFVYLYMLSLVAVRGAISATSHLLLLKFSFNIRSGKK